jgi:predicted RND superfamily exporter protein
LVNRELEKHRDAFKHVHYLGDSSGEELWRISVRVEARKRMDYGAFLDRLQDHIDPLLDQLAAANPKLPRVRATLCGAVPLIHKAQTQLLRDLLWSFVTAFVLVAVTMIVVLRSLVGGLLVMVPNIVPSVLVFGMLGWSGVVIDIGAMMTASVALGIAVDDTLHFVVWFRRGMTAGYDRQTAVRYAFSRCGTAMLQTSLICGLGLLGYAFSPFVPISRFSWLMSCTLFCAILGDLVALPALLASPLGRFFEVRHTWRWRPLLQPLWRPVRKLQQAWAATW